MLKALSVLILISAGGIARAQGIEVPYRGLDYSMLSRDGLTVMIAPMQLSILNYSAAHVWITNGTKRTVQVRPEWFTARLRNQRVPQPAEVAGANDATVVTQVMQRARFGDVMALVRAYERNLYGFKNQTALNYYQQRKQIAASEGSTRRITAAARVSALILQKTEIPPGEFREGTVFFPSGDRKSEFLGFSTRLGGESFLFRLPTPPSGSAPP